MRLVDIPASADGGAMRRHFEVGALALVGMRPDKAEPEAETDGWNLQLEGGETETLEATQIGQGIAAAKFALERWGLENTEEAQTKILALNRVGNKFILAIDDIRASFKKNGKFFLFPKDWDYMVEILKSARFRLNSPEAGVVMMPKEDLQEILRHMQSGGDHSGWRPSNAFNLGVEYASKILKGRPSPGAASVNLGRKLGRIKDITKLASTLSPQFKTLVLNLNNTLYQDLINLAFNVTMCRSILGSLQAASKSHHTMPALISYFMDTVIYNLQQHMNNGELEDLGLLIHIPGNSVPDAEEFLKKLKSPLGEKPKNYEWIRSIGSLMRMQPNKLEMALEFAAKALSPKEDQIVKFPKDKLGDVYKGVDLPRFGG